MTAGETLYLILVLVAFEVFTSVLAYSSHQCSRWRQQSSAAGTAELVRRTKA
jgi:hypothetical protein